MSDDLDLLRTVSRLARELSASFDVHLRELNLTSARARVLLFLAPLKEGASQGDVTAYLGVEHPTAVRILDGIEALGYVQRVPSPQDRRAKLIVLTAPGEAIAKKVSKLIDDLNTQLIQDLNAGEVAVTNRVLTQLLTRAQSVRFAPAGSVGEGAAS